MASWYRRFISQFATVTEPFTRLLRKNQPWRWGEDQNRAFEKIKEYCMAAPTLSYLYFSLPFVLQTDASSVGLGAVLTQNVGNTEQIIAFASCSLSDAEKRYSVTEQECLAVVWAIQKFRPYLEGYKFTVITDHSSLRWLHRLKNPTGRLARWALELLEYDYEIVHRKGALHHVPDALSRMYEGENDIPLVSAIVGSNHNDENSGSDDEADVDSEDSTMEEELVNPPDPWYCKQFQEIRDRVKRFTDWKIVDGHLYYLRPRPVVSDVVEDLDKWKMVLPKELRREAMIEAHEDPQAGHLGVEKTYQRLLVNYYWPNM